MGPIKYNVGAVLTGKYLRLRNNLKKIDDYTGSKVLYSKAYPFLIGCRK
jgi:hypothetical protein